MRLDTSLHSLLIPSRGALPGWPGGHSFFFASPASGAVAGMCARLRSHFLSFRRKKVSKERATPLSATRSFAAGNLSCGGLTGNRSNSLRSDNRGSFSRQTAATQAHTEGGKDTRASTAVVRRRVAQGWAGLIRGRDCLSAASLSGTPPRPSNAANRHTVPATHSARLSFGYFSLAKQRKVPRPPGRDPASARSNNQIKG